MASELCAHLEPHPSTAPGPVRAITVTVRRESTARLHLCFHLDAEPQRLRLPPPAPGAFTLGLWEHTCFEAFVAADFDDAAYHELNLSPSGDWAVFAFARYRELEAIDVERSAPRLTARTGAHGVELEAEVDLAGLSSSYAGSALRLGLSAVVEADDGALSYWSLAHPPGRPDFHHHAARALRLPAPERGAA